MTYTHKEVVIASRDYFDGDNLAATVFANKYALKQGAEYHELTPDGMHIRLAKEFARIEEKYPNPMSYEQIYGLLANFRYIIPQGSPMAGIGNPFQVTSLSNCFVIDPAEDSYGGIMRADEEQVQLMKRRGGVGHDLSNIRPKGTPVNNSAGTSTGIVPYMERFSNSTREVAQDGRRGALMLSISVHHPDAPDFIAAKQNQTSVTGANVSVRVSDEFMQALNLEEEYTQYWTNGRDGVYAKADPQPIWRSMMEAAWGYAEPGILFWDTILRESPADCYEEFQTSSTNPCLTGETLVSVADGRGYVSIKELAEAGDDVPVYTLTDRGALTVRTMRNPRVTGWNKSVYKLTLENGHTIRATANHKFLLTSGEYRRLDQLRPGDSLYIKERRQEVWNAEGSHRKNLYEKLYVSGRVTPKFEHQMIRAFYYGEPENVTGTHIHHIDHNSLNNSPENLDRISAEEHMAIHAEEMLGLNNPIYKIKADPERFAEYSALMSESTSGAKNGNALEVDTETLVKVVTKWVSNLGYRPGRKEYQKFAKSVGLPQVFADWRKSEIGVETVVDLLIDIANDLGFFNTELDPRLQKTYLKAVQNGYEARIEKGKVYVLKYDEYDQTPFWAEWNKREVGFANHSNAMLMSSIRDKAARDAGRQRVAEAHKAEAGPKQTGIYIDLANSLGRDPYMKEWEAACKEAGVPYRVGKHSAHSSYKSLKASAVTVFNHKVISVEEDGYEDVYNGTVDEFHNFFAGGFEEVDEETGARNYLSINQLQCGEIPLSPNDACRLLAINLYSYISDPFQPGASFNSPLFVSHVGKAMRLMDDIVDLEVERIDKILEKIEASPENESVKSRERALWTRMRKAALDGRRTGLGHTGGADAMAALGLTYGSEEANEWFVIIQRILAETAYRESLILANERGAFPVYDSGREEDHPFLTRVGAIGHPRRNIALLTIAPTGTTSLMAQTSSGIEPVFMLAYKRRRKVNPNDPAANITFVDEVGDSWEEYNVVHHKFMDYLSIYYGYTRAQIEAFPKETMDALIADSPYAGATANEIDPIAKVKMQGKMQQWVDHSISVTINLPEDVTVEQVDDIYRTAYTVGCKGMTIYREGSRSGVLVSNDDTGKNEGITENHAPKRPERLPSIGHEFPAMDDEGEAKYYVVMFGMLKGKPYEVFLLPPGSPIIPTLDADSDIRYFIDKVVDGDKKSYNLIRWDNGEETTLGDISRATSSKFYEYGKQVSAMLRHGMPLPYLAQTLRTPLRVGGNSLFQYQNRLANAIETFIPDGAKGAGSCSNCGGGNVIYQEGCLTCHDCGSSKCG